MRCKACNKPFEDYEIHINPKSGEWEDLCTECIGIAFSALRNEEEDGDNTIIAALVSAVGEDWE